ncbi:MAG: extracellular solute-binding protein [Rhizobiaceae bacterium]|nr:extracellular solute-binding protein [Rhizobiaceae bacterium]
MITRRNFNLALGGFAGAWALGGAAAAQSSRDTQLNILCWEGYNTDNVLAPFRQAHPGSTVRAESGTSDPDMINRLRAGELGVWDVLNVNQPWARKLFPENLIKPLNKERFMPYFAKMSGEFAKPYSYAFSDQGDLLGMPQRYGPFSFVVNTDKISRETAEDQGWNLFLDPAMKGRYGVLTYADWNIIHLCLTAGVDPFAPMDDAGKAKFKATAEHIFVGAKLLTDDLVAMTTALINGEIDAYFTGGTYTASPARFDGATNVRAITPKSGPVDGKGGVVWAELTSAVSNPQPSKLAEDFIDFVQKPEIAKVVSFAEGTYNPIASMADPDVFAQYSTEELDAIQWDSLEEEMARSIQYGEIVSYGELNPIYAAAKRT